MEDKRILRKATHVNYLLKTIFVSLIFMFSICGYAKASEFGPFQGKIVDAETKEPIERVVVLIEWRERHAFAGSTFYDAQETLTDTKGEFHLPGIFVFNPLVRLRAEADVIIYKTGYGTTDGINLHGTWKAFIEKEWGTPKGTYIWKFEDERPIILLNMGIHLTQVTTNDRGFIKPDSRLKPRE